MTSIDGTAIAYECAGSGPEVLIVHGGTGDRARWLPVATIVQSDFMVCAMDRRAHGDSGDNPAFSLGKEARDVAAVVAARKGSVSVVGHSLGGVVAYEAAFLAPGIARLVLYEPPLRVSDHSAALTRMETMIRADDRESATATFMREIVQVGDDELAAMQARPTWKTLVDSIETSIRQDRALSANPWNAARARSLGIPTLLIIGSRTRNPDLVLSVQSLSDSLPQGKVLELEGQEHNAMDSDRGRLASVIRDFLTAR